MSESLSNLPLSGLLVVAIEQAVAAPSCTVRLADAGARVIKVERKEGEIARGYDKAVKGTSAYFAWLNRGKESMVLDLKSADDIVVIKKMIAKADVFIQNLAPGAAARLGLGSDALTQEYPRLIAVDIVGYSQASDYKAMKAYDMLVQAESGICAVTGTEADPVKVGVSVADVATGMYAHAMVLEALIQRGISGKGKTIEVAMFDAMADWMSVPLLYQQYAGIETKREGLSHAAIYPYTKVDCADGAIVLAIQSQAEWVRFCEGVLQRPDLTLHELFHDNPSRSIHRKALDQEMNPVFSAMTRSEAIERLESQQIAWGKLTEIGELAKHPALRQTAVTLPTGAEFQIPMPPGRTAMANKKIPALGADTAKIMLEFNT
jgi:crotonobetainyl-CoA:carnitine CoA-transferase CaiB-like acyl-CoA transferase